MTARLRAALFCLLLSTFSAAAHACDNLPSWAQSACQRLDQIWSEGGNDLYFSGYAWHNRAMYSREKINSFNELAWGGGYGRSIYDCFQHERMQQARTELLRGRLSVAHVAADLGYSNPSHFSAAFRKQFGVNPSALRRGG